MVSTIEVKLGVLAVLLTVLGLVMILTGWAGIVGRFIAYACFVALFVYLCIVAALRATRFIYRMEDWDDPACHYRPDGYDTDRYNIRLDTHFHTSHSDGVMSVEEGIKWHLATGFNAFFVTDHDTLSNAAEVERLKARYKDQILVMQGLEITTGRGHVNVLGLKTWDFDRFKDMDPNQHVQEIVKAAHEQGAVVSINHYPWSTGGQVPRWKPGTHLSREDAVRLGVDLMEVSNWDDDIDPIDMESWMFCKDHPIAPVAATDVHVPEKDRMHAWTLLATTEFSEQAVMNELRARRTNVVFKPGGIPYPVKHREHPAFWLVKPLAQIGQALISLHGGGALSNLDKKGVIAWLLHAIALFCLVELACALR